MRVIGEHAEETETFVVDFKRVGLTGRATEDLLLELGGELAREGKELVVVDPRSVLDRSLYEAESSPASYTEDLDRSLERREDSIIKSHAKPSMVKGLIAFHEFEIFRSLKPRELSLIEGLLEMETFPAGTLVISQGSPPDHLYLLAKGSVSICHRHGDGGKRRLRIAAFCPGVCFGDLAVIEGAERSADVQTDEDATCYTLSIERFRMLEEAYSAVYATIITNILRINIDRLRRSNQEIGSLKS
jgi:hypothetical protein